MISGVRCRVRGEKGTCERCLTNFDIYSLDKAGGCGHVEVVLILGVGYGGEDLGGELDRAALGVLRLGGLAGGFIQGGAVAC
jgi:hypothetical protein